jgi:hypothetical protein
MVAQERASRNYWVMRAVMAVIILFALIMAAEGGAVVLTSPDHAQTFAYGEMIWRQLSVDSSTNVMTARVTFSNLPYVGSHEPRIDEPFDFRFPGVRVDSSTRTLFVNDHKGKPIRIASVHGASLTGWIDLTPEAKIYLLKEGGHVTAVLTATNEPRPGMRWIQMDDNWSLQHLMTGLCQH